MSELSKIVETLPLLAKKRADEHKKIYNKSGKTQIKTLDETINKLHDKVFSNIDCLDCGNCCRNLGPRITKRDIDKIAKSLNKKSDDIVSSYLKLDADDDYVFKSLPCPFLGEDNYCAIYENRPRACRDYPHTDVNKQFQIRELTLKNSSICPAVFEILELAYDTMPHTKKPDKYFGGMV